jgi:hypothetical protein
VIDYGRLDKSKIYVAFSQGDTFVSRAIRWFTRSQFSHSFILFWDERWGTWLALGDDWNGFCLTPAKTENTLAVATVPQDLKVGLAKNVDALGSAYNYPGILGMIWVEFGAHVLKRKLHNLFKSKSRWICSEIASQICIDSGVPIDLVPADTDPQMLHDALAGVSGSVIYG